MVHEFSLNKDGNKQTYSVYDIIYMTLSFSVYLTFPKLKVKIKEYISYGIQQDDLQQSWHLALDLFSPSSFLLSCCLKCRCDGWNQLLLPQTMKTGATAQERCHSELEVTWISEDILALSCYASSGLPTWGYLSESCFSYSNLGDSFTHS